MNIERHPFDPQRATEVFRNRLADLAKSLEYARQASHMLNLLFRNAESVFCAGSVVAPGSAEVGQALVLGAQAGVALFACQPPGPPPPLELGEGPPVLYRETAPRGLAAFTAWLNAFHLCAIARRPGLCEALCRVPNVVFRTSDIVGAAGGDYGFADLLRAVRARERFTQEPAFDRVESGCLAQPESNKYVRGVTVPYLRALRRLEAGDGPGFGEALAESIRGHKKFYSAKKYRGEFGPLVSLMLTSAAALAHDRGLRFGVTSDYIPTPWVTGEVFRAAPG